MKEKLSFSPSLKGKITFLVFLSLTYGCAHNPKPTTDFYQRPGINLRQYERIGVLQFSSPLIEASAGIATSDIVGFELLKKGYMVVERARIDRVLTEQGLGLTGAIDESTAAEIGKILGVQALIMGSVGTYKTTSRPLIAGNVYATIVDSSASITLKLIDIRDATVVWAGQGSCTVKKVNNPVIPLRATIVECLKPFPTR